MAVILRGDAGGSGRFGVGVFRDASPMLLCIERLLAHPPGPRDKSPSAGRAREGGCTGGTWRADGPRLGD
jgi:hypothetical protein